MSTKRIIRDSDYFDSPQLFFKNFAEAYRIVESEISKLETRQVYDETGNQSYDLLIAGEVSESLNLIPKIREVDHQLFKKLSLKNVSFKRCRPIILPLSNYLKWEIYCYFENEKMGEEIKFLDFHSNSELFNRAKHDFMIFDSKIAFIHNYNEEGRIVGGWVTRRKRLISELKHLYEDIESEAQYYKDYINKYDLSLDF